MESARETLIMGGLGSVGRFRGMDNEELFDKIIFLNYRMQGIVNLKLLVDEAMRKVNPLYAEVTRMKYFDKITVSDIAKALNLSERGVYGRLKNAEKYIAEQMVVLGYDAEKFEYEYKEEPLVQSVKKGLEKKLQDM